MKKLNQTKAFCYLEHFSCIMHSLKYTSVFILQQYCEVRKMKYYYHLFPDIEMWYQTLDCSPTKLIHTQNVSRWNDWLP